jgi:chromosome segregation ATPase
VPGSAYQRTWGRSLRKGSLYEVSRLREEATQAQARSDEWEAKFQPPLKARQDEGAHHRELATELDATQRALASSKRSNTVLHQSLARASKDTADWRASASKLSKELDRVTAENEDLRRASAQLRSAFPGPSRDFHDLMSVATRLHSDMWGPRLSASVTESLCSLRSGLSFTYV